MSPPKVGLICCEKKLNHQQNILGVWTFCEND